MRASLAVFWLWLGLLLMVQVSEARSRTSAGGRDTLDWYFFSPASESPASHTPAALAGLRFLSLASRLSVFALSCDPQNAAGYNTAYGQLEQRTRSAQAQAEAALGGVNAAESLFDRMRNDDSARLAHLVDLEPVCSAAGSSFWPLVGLSQADFLAQAARIRPR